MSSLTNGDASCGAEFLNYISHHPCPCGGGAKFAIADPVEVWWSSGTGFGTRKCIFWNAGNALMSAGVIYKVWSVETTLFVCP